MPSLNEFLFGKDVEIGSGFTDQQSQLFQQLLSALQPMLQQGSSSYTKGTDYLQNFLSDEGSLRTMQEPALRQFNEEIIPGIAERFSSAGAGGRNSSAFTGQLAKAGSDLESNLASQREKLRQGAAGQLLGASNQGFSNMQQLLGLGVGSNIGGSPTNGAAGDILGILAELLPKIIAAMG